ncbi:uncharacterized protein LAJ45_05565 [Morchella importuna]|uniref:uncharacterized protein n=1 Tax=Morchella importuna TaxID=1174673 RepID=UPI001E8ED687|nr:uncharacterized protein LAJ45_05565 [Morchella importuna]KAH8150354.1 hypothetical protein LAJ45_05565 [Morchella importuna]
MPVTIDTRIPATSTFYTVPKLGKASIKSNGPDLSDLVIPPLRFSVVENKLYRGSYPRHLNFRFLESLNLKTILSVTPEPLVGEAADWCKANGVVMLHIKPEVDGKKGAPLRHTEACQILSVVLEAKNSPLYVHCLNGSEITGLAMTALRKVQCWATPSIISERMRYSETHHSFDRFLEEFSGEVTIPRECVEWLWAGLRDDDGLPPLGCGVTINFIDERLGEKHRARIEKAISSR